MIFLGVLLAATAVLLLTDLALGRPVDARHDARRGMGAALAVAGGAHFAMPTPFLQHLPAWVPAAGALVAATGAIEILLGGALLARDAGTQHIAGRLSAAYLIAVFPANVYVAAAGVDVAGQPGGLYPWIRLPLQALFVAWALWSTPPPTPGTDEPVLGWLPALPWAYGPARRTTADSTTVQGSLLELRRYRDVPGFLVAALQLRAAFRCAPGRRPPLAASGTVSADVLDAVAVGERTHAARLRRSPTPPHGDAHVRPTSTPFALHDMVGPRNATTQLGCRPPQHPVGDPDRQRRPPAGPRSTVRRHGGLEAISAVRQCERGCGDLARCRAGSPCRARHRQRINPTTAANATTTATPMYTSIRVLAGRG